MRLMFVTHPTNDGMGQTVFDLDRVSFAGIRNEGVCGWTVYVNTQDGATEWFTGITHESAVSLYEDIVNHLRSRA